MNNFDSNSQVVIVENFDDLVMHHFSGENNAVCWQRNLMANFEELVAKLTLEEDITEVSMDDLLSLSLSESGNNAREIVINDFKLLTDFGASPSLNFLKCYERDTEFDFISTDVYSYHVDRSPLATDTFLCTYFGASSDIIANKDCVQKIKIPEIRQQLQELYNGSEADFEHFLTENYFDLHYQVLPGVQPTNLGNGHLWRLAVDHPNQQVLPCVHRAPIENEGQLRLLLIC